MSIRKDAARELSAIRVLLEELVEQGRPTKIDVRAMTPIEEIAKQRRLSRERVLSREQTAEFAERVGKQAGDAMRAGLERLSEQEKSGAAAEDRFFDLLQSALDVINSLVKGGDSPFELDGGRGDFSSGRAALADLVQLLDKSEADGKVVAQPADVDVHDPAPCSSCGGSSEGARTGSRTAVENAHDSRSLRQDISSVIGHSQAEGGDPA